MTFSDLKTNNSKIADSFFSVSVGVGVVNSEPLLFHKRI